MNHNKSITKTRTKLFGLLMIAILVVIDQFTKFLASAMLASQGSFVLWHGVFELRYLENQSAAFGFDLVSFVQSKLQISYFVEHPDAFLTFKMGIFAIFTILICLLLLRLYWRIPTQNKRYNYMKLILIAFIAGAIGNCIDRVARGYVVDFFYFCLIDFPIFNVADIYVTVSAGFIIVLSLFYYKEDDFEAIL